MEITKIAGVGTETKNKFSKHGIDTIEQLLVIPPPKIAEILKIDNESAREFFIKAKKAYFNTTNFFKTGLESLKEENSIQKISTGTKALDKLFTGGIECGATTEIYGEFGCGKTQFCHTIAVRSQLPIKEGGINAKVIYLDSEGTFEPDRIVQISKSLNLDSNKILENIIHATPHNSVDQYTMLQEIEKMIVKDDSIKLIIMDSATGLFRQDFSGRGMLSERQKYLDEFLTMASNMANFHKIAIIWTNQVMINPGVFYGDPVTPIGGTVLAHKSTYRVYFKKSGKFRIGKMIDSPKHGQVEVSFGLSNSGVVDKEVVEEEEKQRKKDLLKSKKSSKT